MGRVYLGHSRAGKPVAVKVIRPEHASDSDFLARFRREVDAASRVSGAYTASVLGAGPLDRPPWLATEYVAGPSLAEAVAEVGRLPIDAVWRLAAGLVEALIAVHACDLVHRDLKPANVLLAAHGPRVIDFGISRSLAGPAATRGWTTLPVVTSPGGVGPGTPGFMAPEQHSGQAAGSASDVYALGKVIAYAATGSRRVVDGIGATFDALAASRQPGFAEVPAELRGLVTSCLAFRVADRPSLAQLMDAVLAGARRYPQASPLSFWPESLASRIRAKEDELRRQLAGGQRAPQDLVSHPPSGQEARSPGPGEARLPGRASRENAQGANAPGAKQDDIHWRPTQIVRVGGQGRSPAAEPGSRPATAPPRGLSGGLFTAYRPRPRRGGAARRRSVDVMDAAACALEGDRMFDAGRFTEAADYYQAGIKASPKDSVSHVDLGRALFRLHRGMDAEAAFLSALELDDLLIAAHRNRYLTIDMMTGRRPELARVREEAEGACLDAVGQQAQDPAAFANQGDAYCCLARYQEATWAYRQALAMDGDNPGLLAKLDYATRQRR